MLLDFAEPWLRKGRRGTPRKRAKPACLGARCGLKTSRSRGVSPRCRSCRHNAGIMPALYGAIKIRPFDSKAYNGILRVLKTLSGMLDGRPGETELPCQRRWRRLWLACHAVVMDSIAELVRRARMGDHHQVWRPCSDMLSVSVAQGAPQAGSLP